MEKTFAPRSTTLAGWTRLAALLPLAFMMLALLSVRNGWGGASALAHLALAAWPLLVWLRDRPSPFHPVTLLLSAFVVYYGLAPIPLWLADPQRTFPLLVVVTLAACGLRLALVRNLSPHETALAGDDPTRAGLPAKRDGRSVTQGYVDLLGLWWTVGLVGTALFVAGLDTLPLLGEQAESLRQAVNTETSGWLRFLPYTLIPAFLLSVTLWRFHGKSGWWPIFGGAIPLTVFVLIGNRAPILLMLSGAVLLILWSLERHLSLQGRWLLFFSGLALALVLFGSLGAVRITHDESLRIYPEHRTALPNLALREATQYIGHAGTNTLMMLENVPQRYPYRYGAGYLDPLMTLLPGKQTTMDQQLKTAFGLTFEGGGLVPSTLGEAYVNGGYLGVFLVPYLLTLGLFRLRRAAFGSPALTALCAYAAVHLSALMVSGLASSCILLYFAFASLLIMAFLERFPVWMKPHDA